ncbi:MAG: aspartyl protease family protein [Myxococcales bacterium]|nr:aspartyl protease family protein [Myxococcales bacterium]
MDALVALKALTAKNLIFVSVSLNGAAGRPFVLDTAASATIVDTRVARDDGLEPRRTVHSGGAGAETCLLAEIETVTARVGDTTLSPVYSADLSALGEFTGIAIDGIAGGDLFSKNAVAIDFAAKQVTLSPAGAFKPGPTDVSVALRDSAAICCTIDAELRFRSKRLRGRFLVDTGAPAFDVVLAAPFARRHRLRPGPRAARAEVPGLCATSALVRLAGKARLHLGGLDPIDVTVFASFDRVGMLASGAVDGLVGGELLRRLDRVVVDVSGRRLVVRR